jgi:hypothetical protein
MKSSNWRIGHRRRALALALATTGAVIAGAVAWPIAGAVASPIRVAPPVRFGIHSATDLFRSAPPGYPPPGGIFAPFTDCPILNPLMQESVGGDGMGCVAGDATNGTFTVGSLVVEVAHPVTAQFGVWDPPGAGSEPTGGGGISQFTGGVLPPPDGKELVVSPEFIPGGLLKALGCPNSTPSVEKICKEAVLPGEHTAVYALVQSAGPITNFGLTTWTQPVMIKLINPLLGNYCYLGSTDNPIVLNPSVTGTLGIVPDPDSARFPNVGVLEVTNATATDDTFSVPVAQGCGPGGAANIAIDTAIDTSDGLPSASGNNSLVLYGNFYLADDYAASNNANQLLAAFKASDKK